MTQLKTDITFIYSTEKSNPLHCSTLFYDALFALLILLAKYNPTNTPDTENGELQCSISLERIDPHSRLLTSTGEQFDLQKGGEWFQANNKHPLRTGDLSSRELDYLRERIKKPTFPEIPIPGKICKKRNLFRRYWDYVSPHSEFSLGGLVGIIIFLAIIDVILVTTIKPNIAQAFEIVLGLITTAAIVGPPMGVCIGNWLEKRHLTKPVLLTENIPSMPLATVAHVLNHFQQLTLQQNDLEEKKSDVCTTQFVSGLLQTDNHEHQLLIVEVDDDPQPIIIVEPVIIADEISQVNVPAYETGRRLSR